LHFFVEGKKQTAVKFQNDSQLKLFRFFYEELEIKDRSLSLPTNSDDCEKIFTILNQANEQ